MIKQQNIWQGRIIFGMGAEESFHIENDYTHCLDYKKFDIVPNFIMQRVEDYMNNLIGATNGSY